MNDSEILNELIALFGGNLEFINTYHVCCADILDALNNDMVRYCPSTKRINIGGNDHFGHFYIDYCPFCGHKFEAK